MLGEYEILKICENSVSSFLAPVSITGHAVSFLNWSVPLLLKLGLLAATIFPC